MRNLYFCTVLCFKGKPMGFGGFHLQETCLSNWPHRIVPPRLALRISPPLNPKEFGELSKMTGNFLWFQIPNGSSYVFLDTVFLMGLSATPLSYLNVESTLTVPASLWATPNASLQATCRNHTLLALCTLTLGNTENSTLGNTEIIILLI